MDFTIMTKQFAVIIIANKKDFISTMNITTLLQINEIKSIDIQVACVMLLLSKWCSLFHMVLYKVCPTSWQYASQPTNMFRYFLVFLPVTNHLIYCTKQTVLGGSFLWDNNQRTPGLRLTVGYFHIQMYSYRTNWTPHKVRKFYPNILPKMVKVPTS